MALLQADAEALLSALLRDIPSEEQSDTNRVDSIAEVHEILEMRAARISDAGADMTQCRAACVSGAQALDGVCERHVLVSASMSRAICYERVDDDRGVCLRSCND
ncbi:hypothetical protein GCM10009116_10130 [Brevundimonas basaltis]